MKTKLALFVVIIISLLTCVNLFRPGYFSMHDDLQAMRIYEMEKCLADGQIPCRWSSDMAYGYGQAMFNFYSVFPYYLGALIRIIFPLSILATVRMLFIVTIITSAVGMFLLAKEFFGRSGGILASVLYVYAPYHALNVYVRGALSEAFALSLLPFIWLMVYRVVKKPEYYRIVGLAIFLAVLFTSHNISSLVYAPFTIVWALFWIVYLKNVKSVLALMAAGILAFGLSAFFLLPNLFEQSLIQKEFLTMDYLDWRAHFTTIKQLFMDRSWGYGPSVFGPNDDLSFQIGWPHWWLTIPAFLTMIISFRNRKITKNLLLAFLLILLVYFSAFLTHSKSTPIWLNFPLLSYVQFPWRFLGLTSFFLSFLGAFVLFKKFRFRKLFLAVLILLAVWLNAGYFRPEHYFRNESDESKLSGESFIIQQKSAILDYLPKTSPIAPKEPAPDLPQIVKGSGNIYNFSKRSNSFFFDAELFSGSEIEIPITYYPIWTVISGNKILKSYPHGDYGLVTVKIPEGNHIIYGRFEDNFIRVIANTISVITVFVIFGFSVMKENGIKMISFKS